MTVMPSSCDVADKAVSTEDASSGVEVARLEAVLAALVENKVEAMKADSSAVAAASVTRRAGSAPSSPRRSRITSSSTVSSSQNHHHHHHHSSHHHHGHHHHHHHHDKKGHHPHRHRRHDSAPCGEYIQDPVTHHHKQRHGRGKQKMLDSPRGSTKRRKHSKSPQALLHDIHPLGLASKFELMGVDSAEQNLALLNLDRTREALGDPNDFPRLHRSACYVSHTTAQLGGKGLMYDDHEAFVAYALGDGATELDAVYNDYDDDEDDDYDYEEDEYLDDYDDYGGGEAEDEAEFARKQHRKRGRGARRPGRKRRRKSKARRKLAPGDVESLGVVVTGPLGTRHLHRADSDELSPQARWTIMATACLLLAMSLLLVGVTLRMAPIIDEMVRKENEELLNSLNRDSSSFKNTTPLQL